MNQKKIILSIPLCVLESQVELIEDVADWSSKNTSYFAGNYAQEPLHSTFSSGNFELDIMVKCLNEIISDNFKLNSDFHLRNPEVTLRDDVKVKENSNFKESGRIYARIMDKAFEC